jgi:tetratricopeptide (TPR) repeat protein
MAIGGIEPAVRSLQAVRDRRVKTKRGRKTVTVAAMALAVFAVGSVGLFTTVRSGPQAVPPATAAIISGETLQARPVLDRGSLTRLIADLQARLRAAPGDWQAYASLGLAHVQQARISADPSHYPKAEGLLATSLELHPHDNLDALVGMGTLALARHDFAAALAWGNKAAAVNPYRAYAYGVIGDALIELGRYEEAFDTLQHMVDLRPDLSSYARASYARELQGDVEGAIQAMGLAFNAASNRSDMAWTLDRLGELSFNAGRLSEAKEHYARALSADASFVPAEAGLARVAAATGDVPAAIAGFEAVVARYPLPEYVIALADLYTVTGDEALAERQIELLDAEERLLEAGGVNVDLESALFSADHGVDLPHGLQAARSEWTRRQSVHVADALAWQLYANGRYEEALVYADRALRLGTRNASFLFHAGMIERALGDDRAARAHLAAALDVNPYFSILWAGPAADALASLEGTR